MDEVCVVSYSFFFPENITRGINKKLLYIMIGPSKLPTHARMNRTCSKGPRALSFKGRGGGKKMGGVTEDHSTIRLP